MTPSLTLRLFHGRKTPDANTDGWGFDATPITGIAFFLVTYLGTLRLGFVDEAAFEQAQELTGWETWDDLVLQMRCHGDLVATATGFYGDFEITFDPYPPISITQPKGSS
jgi:hypothetical protein